ncbi:hypothetical protein PCANC_21126 [Puccinia coronata f. sp. avenae]|uniref:Uncharacterized protein n=1 Tax=Puccinia coronata f. sp. avenae TaxID=200324 RepID=A0A2N5SBB0_9BASI|nr:hypothetical protein PCANC_21126 [Puccinia coronata f. sp. avenae]
MSTGPVDKPITHFPLKHVSRDAMWFSTPKIFKTNSKQEQQQHPKTAPTTPAAHESMEPNIDQQQNQQQNLLLQRHPNINFLSTTTTPIPSFPKSISLNSLKLAQRQSEANFVSTFIQPNSAHKPSAHQQQQQTATSTLRFTSHSEEDHSSTINLPYPNPDLSTITHHNNTLIESDIQPHPTSERRISALPSRAHTPFKPFKSPLNGLNTQQHLNSHPYLLHQQPDHSPLSNKLTNLLHSNQNELISLKDENNAIAPTPTDKVVLSPSPKQPAVLSPNRLNFPTPSAALSDILKSQQDTLPNSNTIDQVMAELENRTAAGPRITKITFQDQTNVAANQPDTADRFRDVHDKEFAKYDAITTHYAAKRKNEATSINTRSVTNPSKRAKVSDFGYPKRLVSQQEIDTEQAEKKKEVAKRQLELARSRRRTANGTSTSIGSKPGSSKPTPSGFSSFGTRLIKTAVKTVAGAFKGSQKLTNAVPAGPSAGPSKLPAPAVAPAKKIVGRPTRMITKPPLNRLPPAGHHRLLSTTTTTSASNSLSEAARRRAVSGPSTTLSNPPGTSKPQPRGATTRAQASAATKSTTLSKSTWQPKTLPQPPVGNPKTIPGPSKRINSLKTGPTAQSTSPEKKADVDPTGPTTMCTRSRIPKISTHSHGQTIIRPSVKSCDGPCRRAMMASTSTAASSASTRSVVRIGLSAKKVPRKLSQPMQHTKPIAGHARLAAAALRRTTTTAATGSSFPRKSSSHPSRVIPQKDRSAAAADLPKRKILLLKNRRRSSSKQVGIKAVSHRVTSS